MEAAIREQESSEIFVLQGHYVAILVVNYRRFERTYRSHPEGVGL
jgi:hypothetical protein